MPGSCSTERRPKCSSFYFCGTHCPMVCQCHEAHAPSRVYIPERRVVLPFVLFRSSYCSIATRTIPIPKCFSLPKLPKHHRLGVLTLRDRYVGVQRRSQCWKKNLACANHPRPQHVSVRRRFSPLTRFSKVLFLVCTRLTTKAQDPPSKTQAVHHSGSRATSKLFFFEWALGDFVGM